VEGEIAISDQRLVMSQMSEALLGLKGFEWDQGNLGKNERKHAVTDRECEEMFFNRRREKRL